MSALLTFVGWALFTIIALVVVAVGLFFATQRTKHALAKATEQNSVGQGSAAFVNGLATYTPPPKPKPTAPVPSQRQPAKTTRPSPKPAQEKTTTQPKKKEPHVSTVNVAEAETLHGTTNVLSEAVPLIETEMSKVDDNIADTEERLAEANELFAALRQLADQVPVDKAGQEAHAKLVALADTVGPDEAAELAAARESLVAHRKRLQGIYEATVAARDEFEAFQNEVSDVRATDDNRYQTAGR